MGKLVIDPVTRIEGHLKIEVTVESGVVKDARATGNLFRGLEIMLRGRDPRDAQIIAQRICGVCPQSHGIAAALALDSAFGIADKIPDNARIIRNLIQGAHMAQDHCLHFYHLTALDYVNVADVAKYEGNNSELNSVKDFITRGELGPFFPRYEGDYRLPPEVNQQAVAHYVKALEIRRIGHEMVSIWSGKIPHSVGVIPGGVTSQPTTDKIMAFLGKLKILRDFIDNVYIPDVVAVAGAYPDYFGIGAGCKNLLAYGSYDLEGNVADYTKRNRLFKQGTISADLKVNDLDTNKIAEYVKHSWYEDASTGRHPSQGETKPQPGKAGAYTWAKAPRYDSKVYEVGPLARVLVTYARGEPRLKALVDGALGMLKAKPDVLFSVLGRHLSRALSAKFIADSLEQWTLALKPGDPVYADYQIPDTGMGMGLTDASRGALGHWIEIKDKKIANYQAVVPTTWNVSPMDDNGNHGPIEQALIGTKVKDEKNPFEVVRIIRSFDPCLACSIHFVTPKGTETGRFQIG
ncbi:MAG: nickel-dependent hydrogenase large subunit [Dehalococcoidales bacterium]|nr:nickel-dependent hydrogenase large subunit [Dehalococcoidales bacterium]